MLIKFALPTGMSEFSVNIHLFNVNNQRIRPQKEYSAFLEAKKGLLCESKGGPDGLNIHFSMDYDAQNTHFSIEKRTFQILPLMLPLKKTLVRGVITQKRIHHKPCAKAEAGDEGIQLGFANELGLNCFFGPCAAVLWREKDQYDP